MHSGTCSPCVRIGELKAIAQYGSSVASADRAWQHDVPCLLDRPATWEQKNGVCDCKFQSEKISFVVHFGNLNPSFFIAPDKPCFVFV